MKKLTIISVIFLVVAISIPRAWGKDIIQDAQTLKGDNKAYIRADGLACYFCAYGLERFFRKSGNVAAYDMKMREGVVEITFVKGKPLMTLNDLHQIVYDAGYTPRETSYELVGRLERRNGKYFFHLGDTGESFPVKSVSVLTDNAEKFIGKTMTLKAKAEKYKGDSMLLDIVSVEAKN